MRDRMRSDRGSAPRQRGTEATRPQSQNMEWKSTALGEISCGPCQMPNASRARQAQALAPPACSCFGGLFLHSRWHTLQVVYLKYMQASVVGMGCCVAHSG